MTQRDTLRAMDATLHGALAMAGLADVVGYTAPGPGGAVTVGVRVYVDREAQVFGEFGQLIGTRTEVKYLLADVVPAKGGRITVDGETLINDDKVADDGALQTWVVRRGS